MEKYGNKNSVKNSFLLFVTACIWGMSFVSQSKGMEFMHPFTFNAVRCLIGGLVLLVYLALTGRLGKQKREGTNWAVTIRGGIWCGLLLTAAAMFQQYGIQYTSVGKAGFITTLYIIFVPIAGIFFGRKVTGIVWAAAGMAAGGMYLLCMTEGVGINLGDVLIFLCALFFTAHIMVIDHYSPQTDGVIVSCIQFFVCGVICGLGAFLFGKPELSQLVDGAGTLLYAGVLSCGVGYTLQIVGQKGVSPTVAALILSLESVVATVSGYVAYRVGFLTTDQTLTARQIAGCAIVFAAVILVQLPRDLFKRAKRVDN